MRRGIVVLYGTQDLGQLGSAEFAGSAGPVAVSGETYLVHRIEVKTVVVQLSRFSEANGPRV